MRKIKRFYNHNKREVLVLGLILLVAAFLRLYKIAGYMTFLGDEGRDAIIVRRLLVNFDPILIGPGTSIGNMYLGPLYYYLIAPSLLFANFSPVGPSVFVALLGVLTVALIWWVGRVWFGPKAGLIASFLYSISPTVIIYSRSSWNPNVMPFFALMCFYAAWQVWEQKKFPWLMVMAIALAFVLQSHYLGLLLAPALGIVWLLALFNARRLKKSLIYVRYSVLAFLIFAFLMSPLVIFDLRHNFINFHAIKTFFAVRQTTVSARPWNAIPQLWPLWQQFITRIVAGRVEVVGKWVAMGIIGLGVWVMGKNKKITPDLKEKSVYLLLFLWVGFGLLGLGLYKQHIYDHYFGFLYPAPFLLVGAMLGRVIDSHKIRGLWLAGLAIIFITWANLANLPLKDPPNYQLRRTAQVADAISQEASGEPFNLAVIAERNYEDAYQYFLEKWRTGVVDIDPLQADRTITNQLFVVCEKPESECDPTHNPKAGVANFGWSQIEKAWQVEGVTVFKLVHTEPQEEP